ncbi:MAG: LysM peptidoglycan-binding domain-containing protein [Saprospiraceae bacterium]|nr:LysM peptidoglycan-binding domain-containing protein [Saprospiraceae bacterium]
MQELYFYNPSLEGRMPKAKEPIRVPIPNRAIYRYEDNLNPAFHIPVFFIVGKGQTLYTISNTYFKMSVEQMKRRNHLTTDKIEENQRLFIGWMNIKGIPPGKNDDDPDTKNNPILKEYYDNKNTYSQNCNFKTEWEHKGLAKVTTQSGMKTVSLVALHDYAPINSIILIENPSEKKSIYARVIGRIPPSLKEEDANVILVVSEIASQLLMIIDNRFFAEVRYLK